MNTQLKFLGVMDKSYNFELKQAKQVYGVFGVILRIFQVCLWTNHCFLPAVSLARPWSPELLSSLMPNARRLGWEWRLLFSMGQFYLLATKVEAFLMLVGFLLLVTTTTAGLLSVLR